MSKTNIKLLGEKRRNDNENLTSTPLELNGTIFNNKGIIQELNLGESSDVIPYFLPTPELSQVAATEANREFYNSSLYVKKIIPYVFEDGKSVKFDFTTESLIEWNGIILAVTISNPNLSNYIQLDGPPETLIKKLSIAIDGVEIEKYDDYGKIFLYENLMKQRLNLNSSSLINDWDKKVIISPQFKNSNLILNPEFIKFDYTRVKKIKNGAPNVDDNNSAVFEIVLKSAFFGNLFAERVSNLNDTRGTSMISISVSFNEDAFFVPVFNGRIDDLTDATTTGSEYEQIKILREQYKRLNLLESSIKEFNTEFLLYNNEWVHIPITTDYDMSNFGTNFFNAELNQRSTRGINAIYIKLLEKKKINWPLIIKIENGKVGGVQHLNEGYNIFNGRKELKLFDVETFLIDIRTNLTSLLGEESLYKRLIRLYTESSNIINVKLLDSIFKRLSIKEILSYHEDFFGDILIGDVKYNEINTLINKLLNENDALKQKEIITNLLNHVNFSIFFDENKPIETFKKMKMDFNNSNLEDFGDFFLFPEVKFNESLDMLISLSKFNKVLKGTSIGNRKAIKLDSYNRNHIEFIKKGVTDMEILWTLVYLVRNNGDKFGINFDDEITDINSNEEKINTFKFNSSPNKLYIPKESQFLSIITRNLDDEEKIKSSKVIGDFIKNADYFNILINGDNIDVLLRKIETSIFGDPNPYKIQEALKGIIIKFKLIVNDMMENTLIKEDLRQEFRKLIHKCDTQKEIAILINFLPSIYYAIHFNLTEILYYYGDENDKKFSDRISEQLKKIVIDGESATKRLLEYFSGESMDKVKSTLLNEIVKRERNGKFQPMENVLLLEHHLIDNKNIDLSKSVDKKYSILETFLEIKFMLNKNAEVPNLPLYMYNTLANKVFDVDHAFSIYVETTKYDSIFFYFTLMTENPFYRKSTMMSIPFEKFTIINGNLTYPPKGLTGTPNDSENNGDFLEELAFAMGFKTNKTELALNLDKYKFKEIGNVSELEIKTRFNHLNFALENGTCGLLCEYTSLTGIENNPDKTSLLISSNKKYEEIKNRYLDLRFDTFEEIQPNALFGFDLNRIQAMTNSKMTEFKFTFDQMKLSKFKNKLKINVFAKVKLN